MNLEAVLDSIPVIKLLPDPIQGIILVIAAILVINLIKSIFLHPVYSRIAGIIIAIVAFVLSLKLPIKAEGADINFHYTTFMILTITNTFSYLFSMGSTIFEVYWDGSYRLTISTDNITLNKNTFGGFFGNFIGSAICTGLVIVFGLAINGGSRFILCLVPMLYCFINLISLFSSYSE